MLTEQDRGALRLSAVCAEALALGLTPGMTLADARARLPELDVRPHDSAADAQLLEAVLDDFQRFTPMAALDQPHGVMLDVTGCAHLFGGEDGMIRRVRARTARIGLQARLAMARTPQTARALARFGAPANAPSRAGRMTTGFSNGIVPEGYDANVAQHLPVAALELEARDHQALRRAGLKTLGDLDKRPRAALAARFGANFPDRLDQLMGRVDARITPHHPPPPISVDRVLAEPITDLNAVQAVLGTLLAALEQRLESTGQGARGFALELYRVDGQARRIALQTGRPVREAAIVMRLFREKLAALPQPIDPGFGFDHLRLGAEELHLLAPGQTAFNQRLDQDAALDTLIDRLGARLGAAAVLRAIPVGSHLPERAWRLLPAQVAAHQVGAHTEWGPPAPEAPPLRPLHLFHPPQPVEAVALAPDSPPARFQWRRATHRVVRAEGPERLEGEWWRRSGRTVRDYYRVEDEEGRRFWLFRAGEYGGDPPPRWYVHGLFA